MIAGIIGGTFAVIGFVVVVLIVATWLLFRR